MTGDLVPIPWPGATHSSPLGFPAVTASGLLPTGLSSDGDGGLPLTTYFTFTVIGADGLPTPIESTVVATPATEASAALPNIPFPSGLSEVTPQQPEVTSCFSFTYVGADGLPTISHSTIVASAPEGVPDDFGSLPSGIPWVTDGSEDDPEFGAITTCFSYTVVGTDGLPTVVDSTVIIGPTSGGSGGLPTGIPNVSQGLPGSEGTVACLTYTITGADGLPTPVETTLLASRAGDRSSPVFNQGSFPTMTSGISGNLPTDVPYPSGDQEGSIVTTYTYFGGDGLPTIVATTLIAPSPVTTGNALPEDSGDSEGSGITTCATYTYIGADGQPSLIESIFVVPAPLTTGRILPGGYSGGSNLGLTTCATYTYVGADGLPTVVESTYVIPTPQTAGGALPQLPSDGLPPVIPGQITGLPGNADQIDHNGPVSTSCTSFTVLGADGLPTIVETTFTVPGAVETPTGTTIGFPPAVPPLSGLAGIIPLPSSSAITTSFTAISIGPDGLPTPVVQTMVFTPGSPAITAGLPPVPPSGPVLTTVLPAQPQLSGYGAGLPNDGFPGGPFTPIFSDGRALPGSDDLPPFVTGVPGGADLPGASSLPPSYDDLFSNGDPLPGSGQLPPYGSNFGAEDGSQLPGSDQAPPYDASNDAADGGFPSEITLWPSAAATYGGGSDETLSPAVSSPCTTLQTTTWANLIPEQTTTYTINYPLTTLATITPGPAGGTARLVRRQER